MVRSTLLHRSGVAAAFALIATVSLVAAAPAQADTVIDVPGLPADSHALVGNQARTIFNPADASPAWLPLATAFDGGTAANPTRPVNVGFKTHYDFDPYSDGREIRSTDGGVTFGSPVDREVVEAAARLDSGQIIGPLFKSQVHTNPPSSQFTIRMRRATADDPNVGTDIVADADISPLVFSHPTNQFFPTAIVQVPNGPLLMAGYSYLRDSDGVARTSAYLFESTADPANGVQVGERWQLRSVIAKATSAVQYSEVGMALDRNGEVVVAVRDSNYGQLNMRRSTDLGQTWGPITAPVLASGQQLPARIMPELELLPNGMLVLESGRLDNWIAVSHAGDGRRWDQTYRFYTNHYAANPTDPNEGSSGNGAVVSTESNRIAAFADSCHAVVYQEVRRNKCTWRSHQMTDTQDFMLKGAVMDVLTPGAGKIDLAGKYRSGAISVSSDLGAVSGHARTGVEGAFDGSTETWSSAIRSGTGSGTFDITLDREYTLSKVGLSQLLGGTQSAIVQTKRSASDPWTTWYDAGSQESFSVRYSPADQPAVKARYVRVSTDSASFCPSGVAAPCSALGELELYASDVDSFENDPVNGIPRGWTVKETVETSGAGHIGVWVSKSASGSGTSRVLRIVDSSTKHLPLAFQNTGSSSAKTLEFRFKPEEWRPAQSGVPASAFLFGIRAGSTATAYHLAVASNGQIRWYDKATGTWSDVGTVHANPNGWSTIRVQAGSASASIFVDDQLVGSVSRSDRASTALTGHQFSASATGYAQESFVVDDVVTANS